MENVLSGKTAIVTGGGQGIGRGIALRAAQQGASVVVNDLGSKEDDAGNKTYSADTVVEEIKAAGGHAVADYSNIADPATGDRLVSLAMDTFGGLTSVVNCAGNLRDAMFHKMSLEDFDAVVNVHLRGYFSLSKAAGGIFRQEGGGSFVHFTSQSGLIGSVGQANYMSAKMGIVGLSTAIAHDMQRFNVRSNCIAPWAWSALVASVPVTSPEMAHRMEMNKKYARAEQIAPVATFLLSDLAQDVNAQIFGVRGKEVFLFSQPRPIRSVQHGTEWDEQLLADKMVPMFEKDFTDLIHHIKLVSWTPS